MVSVEFFLLCLVIFGAVVVWASESTGTIVRAVGIQLGLNVLGGALVQRLSVISRLGVFVQTMAMAWVIDEGLLIDHRLLVAVAYVGAVVIATTLTQALSHKIYLAVYSYAIRRGLPASLGGAHMFKFQGCRLFCRGSGLATLAYVFLYVGAVFPLLGQSLSSALVARSIAIASVLNGVSTLILIGYIEMRMAVDVERTGVSTLPRVIYSSKYSAQVIVLACLLAFVALR
jgi:hypothetical protein